MRREWEPEELIAAWTLLDGDWDLVRNKTGATRLSFSLFLKFFDQEGRFLRHVGELPKAAVDYIAGQVKVDGALLAEYDWSGRSIERHRAQVREALEFRESTRADEDVLAEWLADKICPINQRAIGRRTSRIPARGVRIRAAGTPRHPARARPAPPAAEEASTFPEARCGTRRTAPPETAGRRERTRSPGPSGVAVYGASGYQGKLVLTELARRDIETVLAGRDPTRLEETAAAAGLPGAERRVADTGDHEALVSAFRGCDGVINCAGPFTSSGEAAVRAAIAAGCHYVDTSGEQLYVKKIEDRRLAGVIAALHRRDRDVLLVAWAELLDGSHRPRRDVRAGDRAGRPARRRGPTRHSVTPHRPPPVMTGGGGRSASTSISRPHDRAGGDNPRNDLGVCLIAG